MDISTLIMKVEFNKNIIHFKEIESTNDFANNYLKQNNLSEAIVITADFQNSGKGQLLNSWQSEPGKNLMISVAFKLNILLENSFDLAIISSLAVLDVLHKHSIKDASVKWPNDILIGKKKIAGILIENTTKGNRINNCVIGVGFNVNQECFSIFNREATSLQIETSTLFKIKDIRDEFLTFLKERFLKGMKKNSSDYMSNLYLKDKVSAFEIENVNQMGIIKEVSNNGCLTIELEDETKSFKMKEIRFLS